MDKHEGNRTPDFQNRNLMLYPLSYMLCRLFLFYNEIINFLNFEKSHIHYLKISLNNEYENQ